LRCNTATGTDVKAVAARLVSAYRATITRRAFGMPVGFTIGVRAA
jgi:hypothetical protein